MEKQKLTPKEVAELWGVPTEKVLGWIDSGELRAADCRVVRKPGGKKRYLIDRGDLQTFWNTRLNRPAPVPRAPRKPARPPGFIEYFK